MENQITFPFIYRELIMEWGNPNPIGYIYDYTDWDNSIYKSKKEMIYCGKIIKENNNGL